MIQVGDTVRRVGSDDVYVPGLGHVVDVGGQIGTVREVHERENIGRRLLVEYDPPFQPSYLPEGQHLISEEATEGRWELVAAPAGWESIGGLETITYDELCRECVTARPHTADEHRRLLGNLIRPTDAAAPTVKRPDLFGNVADTYATERELNGFRETNGRLL